MNRYSYEDIAVGQTESFSVLVAQSMLDGFFKITGDENPLHRDPEFAKRKGFSDGSIAYGMLTASFFSTLAGVYLPGENSLIHRVEAEFPAPVYVGDRLDVSGTVTEKKDQFRTIELKITVKNQNDKKVLRGKMRIGVL